MKVIADFTIVPVGTGVSLSPYVAACEKVLRGAGLKVQLHSNGTNIEGDWDAVFAALKRCHETVHQMGAPRIFSVVKISTRSDRDQTMEEKLSSVQKRLGKDLTGRLGSA
ncbi:MAG: MTH1187 family thiamine-binding protein [Anaerolineales bacterium]|nr:MTH1187 family thiamine-binding protein [Anaerolineales bacterium]